MEFDLLDGWFKQVNHDHIQFMVYPIDNELRRY